MRLRLLFATCMLCASVSGGYAQQSGERQALIDSINVYTNKVMGSVYEKVWQKYAKVYNISTGTLAGKEIHELNRREQYALSKTVLPLSLVGEPS